MQMLLLQIQELQTEVARQAQERTADEARHEERYAAAQAVPDGGNEGLAERIARSLQQFGATTQQARKADMARLGKPDAFCPPADWNDWEFAFLAWAGTLDEQMVEEILNTRHLDTQLGPPDETTGVAGRSRTLFYLMTQLTKKAARKMVRAAPSMHGYEAYRRLSRHYGTATAEASTGILLQILRFSFGAKLDEVEERLAEFTQLVDRHDQVTGLDEVAPSIKRAVLLGNVPEPLKTHLQLNSVNLETFDKVYSATAEYLRGRRIYETTAGAGGKQGAGAGHKDDPMDIDALWRKGKAKGKGKDKKGKGKGKEKGKGKADGKGKDKGKEAKTPRFEGYCRSCGKWGHRASDCWAKAEVQAVETPQPGQLAIQNGQATQQPQQQPQQATQMIGEVVQTSELQPWIFALSNEPMITYLQNDKDMVRLLVDSGCFGHVCTRWCFPHSPLIATTGLSAQAANSSVIKHYGENRCKV